MPLFDDLDEDALSYTAVGGGFVDLVGGMLGDELTDTDGFTELLNGALLAIPDDEEAFSTLDSLLGAADFADDALDDDVLAEVAELVDDLENTDLDFPDL